MKYMTKLYILAAAIILAVVLLFFLFRNSEEPPDAGGGLPADVEDEDGQIDVSLNLEEGQGGESTITDDGAAPIKLEAKPFIPVKQNDQPINYVESTSIIGVRGKFGSEGGFDVNNKTKVLTFNPAKSAEIHIEHVDVHRADPVNKNGSITFKYRDGIEKFAFVGNGGLRFQKRDGSFGPNMGVGDVSRAVLADAGFGALTYKIECLKTAGRNTWSFKPLDLSRGLIGIELSDNADWGGLRGVYVNVKS